MKKFIYFLTFAAFFISCSDDDTKKEVVVTEPPVVETDCVFAGDIQLDTQAQVDAFAAKKYCSILGQLQIGSTTANSDITSLVGLKTITNINGMLHVVNNPKLVSLAGLDNITKTQRIIIHYNDALQNIDNLNVITKNDFAGYDISNNASLSSLGGLKGTLSIESLQIDRCPLLSSLKGLENCIKIDDLNISSCPLIKNLDGLKSIEELGSININTTGLESLAGLSKVKNIGGLSLQNNTKLSSLNGLTSLAMLGSLTFVNNALIVNFDVLKNASISGVIRITDNSGLKSLQGLEGTKQAVIYLQNNPALTSLQGLQNLTHTGGISIIDNNALTSIEQLASLKIIQASFPSKSSTYPDGGLVIKNNASLTSLNGLQNVTSFLGELIISTNASLTDFCAIKYIVTNGYLYGQGVYNNANPLTLTDIRQGNCN